PRRHGAEWQYALGQASGRPDRCHAESSIYLADQARDWSTSSRSIRTHSRIADRPAHQSSGMAETRPPDRTPFFEFQARNRRATWRLSFALAVIVAGGGFVSAVGFVVNIFLALFALVFFPTVLCLGIGALFLLSPATAGLARPLWDIGVIPLEI